VEHNKKKEIRGKLRITFHTKYSSLLINFAIRVLFGPFLWHRLSQ